MSRKKEWKGKRIGKVEVLEELDEHITPNGQKKRRFKCRCECGKEFVINKNTIMKTGSCSSCKTKEERLQLFLSKLKKANPNIEYISGFENYKKHVKCKCKICGNVWETGTPDNLTKKKNACGCPECKNRDARESKTLTQKEFEKLVKIKNPDICITSQYINARKPISFKCKKCGYNQTVKFAGALSERENYCPRCNKRYRYNNEEFVKEMFDINPDIEILGEYVANNKAIECRCKICGYQWNPRANQIKRGSGCPECNVTGTSFAEQVLLWTFRRIYGNNNVLHRDKKTIGEELDIYIPAIHLAIEPGGWHWHESKYIEDIGKHEKCVEKGIRCIVIYDQVKGDISTEYPKEDFWFYDCDLGKNHSKLKEIVNKIQYEVCGKEMSFSKKEWDEIILCAKEQNNKRHEVFISKLKEKNSHYEDIKIKGRYYRNNDSIDCECKICGYGKNGEWRPSGASLLNGSGCPMCAGNLCTGTEGLQRKLDFINSGIVIKGEYKNTNTEILCYSKNCGHEWMEKPRELLKGAGCPICNLGKRVTHDQFVERIHIYRPDIEILSEYTGSKNKVMCMCRICGYGEKGEWMAIPTALYKKSHCPDCSEKQRWKTRKEKYGNSGGTIGRRVKNVETGEIYPSIKEAASSIGRTIGALNLCLAGKTSTCAGYHWVYVE